MLTLVKCMVVCLNRHVHVFVHARALQTSTLGSLHSKEMHVAIASYALEATLIIYLSQQSKISAARKIAVAQF